MNFANSQLFVDLDGVLVNFNAGVQKATGKLPGEMHPKQMWPILARTPDFYNTLDWMPDGRKLWDIVSRFNPIILTGLPIGQWSEGQKRSWCQRELGESVPVITGLSRNKAELALEWLEEHNHSNHYPILIDDNLRLKDNWELTGGYFIFHISAKDSIVALRDLGFPV